MHFPSTFAVTVILSTALASAVPLPKHTHLGSRRLSRRQELIERLQARGPISVSTIQHFTRAEPSGGDKCIDGALDYIFALATASRRRNTAIQERQSAHLCPSCRFATFGDLLEVPSNATALPTPDGSGSAGNSTDATLPFLDDCLEELVAWAVTKFVTLLEASSGAENALPAASDAPSPLRTVTLPTIPPMLPPPTLRVRRHVRRAWVDDFIENVLAKISWIPDLTSASLAEGAGAQQPPQFQTKRQVRRAWVDDFLEHVLAKIGWLKE
ncbi:hypothetical protein B0H10DRAFT_2222415 [Mycena sp. CBHHK59/15]|nr:hypothetical protein B0H10DRAFT_2222415 [Mycena sp. CBHHK59/15]